MLTIELTQTHRDHTRLRRAGCVLLGIVCFVFVINVWTVGRLSPATLYGLLGGILCGIVAVLTLRARRTSPILESQLMSSWKAAMFPKATFGWGSGLYALFLGIGFLWAVGTAGPRDVLHEPASWSGMLAIAVMTAPYYLAFSLGLELGSGIVLWFSLSRLPKSQQ